MKLHFLVATLTKVLSGLVLALLISTIPQAIGETNAPISNSDLEVTGQVRLVPASAGSTLEDSSNVVVWLAPTQPGQNVRVSTELLPYRIIQHHKMFEPHLLVVPVGSTVEFPNHDPWFHNVFSLSSSKRFDLGLYDAGVQKAVKFDRVGASYLFCSIHPAMVAIVLTVDSKYFGISDKTGHILISNVPPGKYSLHVWYENAAPQALEALRRAIVVGDDNRILPVISIALANGIATIDKNENSDQATSVGANRGRR